MVFKEGHGYYPKKAKTGSITDKLVTVQKKKALDGDTRAFDSLAKYYMNKGKIDAEAEQKFNPDLFLKAFDEAVLEREDIIEKTTLDCVKNA